MQSGLARQADYVIVDTAGRLHTKFNLMEELKKVQRVAQKIDPTAMHEVLLVLDATSGQNALEQTKAFGEAVGVTGVILTKLDGTAKGGVAFAIRRRLAVPIKFVGTGEKVTDFAPFDAEEFVSALFN
jgi:fused signal recognition particle receptor